MNLESFYNSYLECIDFTEFYSDNPELLESNGYSYEFLEATKNDCKRFLGIIKGLLPLFPKELDLEKYTAHDFWFTRNGHGVGFWSRPDIYGDDLSEQLTKISENFGEQYVYLGDDNLIYID